MGKQTITVEVAYLGEEGKALISLSVLSGTTVLEVIQSSEILLQFPILKIVEGRVGIFGKVVALETLLNEGDRVEIYRDLKRDPKEARRERVKIAKRAAAQRASSKRTTLSPLKKTENCFSTVASPFPGFK